MMLTHDFHQPSSNMKSIIIEHTLTSREKQSLIATFDDTWGTMKYLTGAEI